MSPIQSNAHHLMNQCLRRDDGIHIPSRVNIHGPSRRLLVPHPQHHISRTAVPPYQPDHHRFLLHIHPINMHPTHRQCMRLEDNEDRATTRSVDTVDMRPLAIPLRSRMAAPHTRLRIRTNIVGSEEDITIHMEVMSSTMRAGDCHNKNQWNK